MFKVGSRYLARNFLRHRHWWNSEDGYKIFENDDGELYTIDSDGDCREVEYLDASLEVILTLENE